MPNDSIKRFFLFCKERHAIWHKRFLLKEPPPWTEDPILRERKFTNIYRELDRGTVYLWEHAKSLPRDEMYFAVIAFRYLNNWKIFEQIGGIPSTSADFERIRQQLRQLRDRGISIFSRAYRTICAIPMGAFRVDAYVDLLQRISKNDHVNFLHRAAKDAPTAELFYESFLTLPHVGPFLAYEIYSDIIRLDPEVKWSEDDFVHIGPGAERGLSYIFKAPYDGVEKAKQLRKVQKKYLPTEFKELTLRNIEHSLCEWGKLCAIQDETQKTRRPFFFPEPTPILYENCLGAK